MRYSEAVDVAAVPVLDLASEGHPLAQSAPKESSTEERPPSQTLESPKSEDQGHEKTNESESILSGTAAEEEKWNQRVLTEHKSISESPSTTRPTFSNPPPIEPESDKSKWQILGKWLPACLSLILLILTSLYAFRPGLWKSDFINSSQSHAIFVLRALSEVTGFLLAITVSSAFETVQWLLAVGADGMAMTDYLALQPGTGMLGLLSFAVGGTKGRGHTRLWSILRLIATILLPGLGVLIMCKFRLTSARTASCLLCCTTVSSMLSS